MHPFAVSNIGEGSLGDVLWISHRGLKVHHTENSLEAFEAAAAAGFRHLETDLRSGADGTLVLCHDESLVRVAGLDSYVTSMDRADLSQVVLSGGERLALFDTFASKFRGFGWTLDIKREFASRTIEALAAWAKRENAVADVVARCRFVMWSEDFEVELRRHFPGAVCYARKPMCYQAAISGMLTGFLWPWVERGRVYAVTATFLGIDLFRPWVIRAYQRRGAGVIAYLPASEAEISRALASGVNEIIADLPPIQRSDA